MNGAFVSFEAPFRVEGVADTSGIETLHVGAAFLAVVRDWAAVAPHPLLAELARGCACGVDLGDHAAEAPWGCVETGCEGFRPGGAHRMTAEDEKLPDTERPPAEGDDWPTAEARRLLDEANRAFLAGDAVGAYASTRLALAVLCGVVDEGP